MKSRSRSTRAKIAAVLLVPLVSLLGFWGYATTTAVLDGLDTLDVRKVTHELGEPTEAVLTSLQKERLLSATYLGGGSSGERTAPQELREQRERTDRAATRLRNFAGGDDLRGTIGASTERRLDEMLKRLETVDDLRAAVDARARDRQETLAGFTAIIRAAFHVYERLPAPGAAAGGQTSSSDSALRDSLVSLVLARELLSREHALLSGALDGARLSPAERLTVSELAHTRRFLYKRAVADLPPKARSRYERLAGSEPFGRLQTLEDQLIKTPAERDNRLAVVRLGPWTETANTVLGTMGDLARQTVDARRDDTQSETIWAVGRVAVVGGVGLLLIIASIVIAVRTARPLVREMRTLSAGTRDFAYRRLPLIQEQLRRGEETDGDFDAPTYPFTTTETVELVESFVTARRAAVQAAIQEASLRRGIGDIFLNLARRNQALLHRQLSLIDTMERSASDPDELENLFRLDHLATRMRRHAEGLVILSGAPAGRGWRHPVPLVDVIRGAVAEVEDYARVTVLPMQQVSLAGPVVADTIHLVAELVENATLFSPPHTTVRVGGQLVGNGFVVEIEDRGLGMSSEDLVAANDLLERAPEFDLSDSAQLGLFVVSRLARRHEIKVSLRPSPYGGSTAIVLIPWSIVVQDGGPEPAGAHAGLRAGDTEGAPHSGPDAGRGVERAPVPELVSAGTPARTTASERSDPATPSDVSEPTSRTTHARTTASERSDPAILPERGDQPGPAATGRHQAPAYSGGGNGDHHRTDRVRPEPAEGGIDLPQRVRQASLAPQLREQPPGQDDRELTGTEADPRPDTARATMASIQQGARRGRAETDPGFEAVRPEQAEEEES